MLPRQSLVRCVLVLGLWVLLVPSSAVAQIEELPRPDTAHTESFGVAVALNDSFAVVGASGETACGPNAGAVYVYEREPGPKFDKWKGVTRITPRDCQPATFFGQQVVLSGRRLLVSASSGDPLAEADANAAYVFTRTSSGDWEQTARFTGSPGRAEGSFATSIDLEDDRAVVTTSGNPDAERGGAVYVYDYDPAEERWGQSARLTASEGTEAGVLGQHVALSGNRLAVAASTYFEREPGSVYIFRYDDNTGEWRESTLLRDIDSFFIELDLYGSVLIVGEDRAGDDDAGQALLYTNDRPDQWSTTQTLRPSVPYESGSFGTAVSINESWALVTGYGEQLGKDFNIDRVVYAFRRNDGQSWQERTILDIGEVDFGAALDQYKSKAIISSVPENRPGTAYIVHLQ